MSDYMRNRRGEESDSFFCRFTFGQFFALLVLEVFSLFFVFYLGARYGREFLGLDAGGGVEVSAAPAELMTNETKVETTAGPGANELARELVAKAKTPELKDRIAKMFEGAARDSGAAGTPPVVEVRREDAAGAASVPEAPTAEAAPPAALQTETQAPTAAPQDGSSADQVGRATSDDVKSRGDHVALRERRATEASVPAADTGVVRVKSVDNARYSVQVGSYPKMDEATRSVEKWKGKGYSAYMMIANIPDRGQWYRVRIGGFSSHDEAAKYLSEFKSRENVEALVVMNEQ